MTVTPALPTFDLALRGYDRRQVDEYLDRIEHDLAVAQADRDAASARIAATEKRLNVLDNELAVAHEQLTEGARPTYAGLGKRVEQLLSIAEEEAERLRADAQHVLDDERAAASELFEEAQRKADRANREFTAELELRRREAEQEELAARAELDTRLKAVEKRIAEAEMVANTRIGGAKAEAERLLNDAKAHAERLRADAEQRATALVQAARHDVEGIAHEAKSEAATIIAEARAQAEQGRSEHAREMAELLRRRQSIHSQLKTLRHVLGTLPDSADDDEDIHSTLVQATVAGPGTEPASPAATDANSADPTASAQPAGDQAAHTGQAQTDPNLRKTGT